MYYSFLNGEEALEQSEYFGSISRVIVTTVRDLYKAKLRCYPNLQLELVLQNILDIYSVLRDTTHL